MPIMDEGNLRFDFTSALSVKRFDDKDNHGLTHCMKSVDFIVELAENLIFVEVKDPQNPEARPEAQNIFYNKLKNNTLIIELSYKYRDSYLYEKSMGNINKPVLYVVLLEVDGLNIPEMSNLKDRLRKYLPVEGPPGRPWKNKFVKDCIVLNIEAWNRYFAQFPLSRI